MVSTLQKVQGWTYARGTRLVLTAGLLISLLSLSVQQHRPRDPLHPLYAMSKDQLQ